MCVPPGHEDAEAATNAPQQYQTKAPGARLGGLHDHTGQRRRQAVAQQIVHHLSDGETPNKKIFVPLASQWNSRFQTHT